MSQSLLSKHKIHYEEMEGFNFKEIKARLKKFKQKRAAKKAEQQKDDETERKIEDM